MTPGILNVSAAARSVPPSSKAIKAGGRSSKARTTTAARSQTGGGGMMITQPSGRLARARAERKLSATPADDPSATTKITTTPAPLSPASPPAPTALPRMPRRFPPSNQANSNKSHPSSNSRRRPHHNKGGAKYPRRFELELYDHQQEQDLDMEMEASSDEKAALSSGEEQTSSKDVPITPPAFIPSSSSFPLENAFPSFLTPPCTPVRPVISHTRSLSHTLRTPSTPFTPPLTHHTSSSTTSSASSTFSFPSTPPSSSILSSRYANSTFQHSPSPNVLPKPRFLDADPAPIEGLPESEKIPSASQLQMLFGDSLMFDVEMEN